MIVHSVILKSSHWLIKYYYFLSFRSMWYYPSSLWTFIFPLHLAWETLRLESLIISSPKQKEGSKVERVEDIWRRWIRRRFFFILFSFLLFLMGLKPCRPSFSLSFIIIIFSLGQVRKNMGWNPKSQMS